MGWQVPETFLFDPEPAVRRTALELYHQAQPLGILSPHGHIPPSLLADPNARFLHPTELFVRNDHYVFRLLYSQGIPLESLGVGVPEGQYDPVKAWEVFCRNFHLFDGTPTGLWLRLELTQLFGVTEKPNARNAHALYEQIQAALDTPAFAPRALFKRFRVEVLATTDSPEDDVGPHLQAQRDGYRVIPTFRPDRLLQVLRPDWKARLGRLEAATNRSIERYGELLEALIERRRVFKQAGATATDHSTASVRIEPLPDAEAERLFARALTGQITPEEAEQLEAHALFDQARLSAEVDGLVMQLHLGVTRNHNRALFERLGEDMGADIPHAVDWTRGLQPLLNEFGHSPLRLILFTLDESTYSRELAPLAGHYPGVRLGAPWWYFDSVLGIERYLDAVSETATLYNTAGFSDDTRAFASIPARHEVWRRVVANWLARRVERGVLELEEAHRLMRLAAYDLAAQAYGLEGVRVG
ncbi:MAG: glucuronate isomerase [Meiothermus sp.]|uniref:glucuronate isomerase n=1 Tax=Meiothermus sp. TaxID=1955249 RepID=UPI0025EF0B17|nr:glucuronate isomerase [Meiothermus sp.]MCS7194666.1 glucuronate isomerase [Meiothermus sp.]